MAKKLFLYINDFDNTRSFHNSPSSASRFLHVSFVAPLRSLIPDRFTMSAPSTMPPGKTIPEFASSASTPAQSSLWDRITTWASENKAVVYTIAGVAVVVTGAGVAYYLSDNVRSARLTCLLSIIS